MKKELKVKPKYFIIPFIIIWCMDFITTVIGLNCQGLYEMNKISAWFFQFGFWGFVINFIFCVIVIILFSYLFTWLLNKRLKPKLRKIMFWVVIGLVILIEVVAIFNNIFWMVR